jgi:hypothetical protein
VWLFHGTTPEIARDIQTNGWRPTHPSKYAAEQAVAHGLDPESMRVDSYALERHARGAASCTTSWRHAAAYSRFTPEHQHFADAEIETLTGERRPVRPNGSVLLLSLRYEALSELTMTPLGKRGVPQPRSWFLPTGDPWTKLERAEQFERYRHEILVLGNGVRDLIVGVDLVEGDCDCSLWRIGSSQINEDPRTRCPKCHLAQLPLPATNR